MSQEYTPVSWQDETTSQQGTLINAERLNQMQTAHHYADGFEEVDEIPTEDPGVDYHKMVYCTADATFYRWDGEVWTADIDEETKHLLDQEIARATQAEGVLRADITAEATARANADTALGQRIDGLGADTLPMTHGTSTPTIQNAVAANAGNIDNLSNEVEGLEASKADKATTLAGYGITDAYTKAQADTLLAGKVDKLVSSPAGTYKSVTVNAQGQVTAGTNPDTLAGYGITDAYNKTEADTLLAAKADTTALTDGSVTKVGTADLGTDTKPIKLVAGVPTAVTNDLVSTSGNQDIAGLKTFSGKSSTNVNATRIKLTESTLGTAIATNKWGALQMVDSGDKEIGGLAYSFPKNQTYGHISLYASNPSNVSYELQVHPGESEGYVTAPARAYNPSNTTDVATIATLDGYSPMVRTSGNQDISGQKTMKDPLYIDQFIRSKHRVLNAYSITTTLGRWVPIYRIDRSGQSIPQASFFINNRIGGITILQVAIISGTLKLKGLIAGNPRPPENMFRASTEDDSSITLWAYFATDDGIRADCISAYGSNSQLSGDKIEVLSSVTGYAITSSGYTDENNVEHTFTRYAELNQ